MTSNLSTQGGIPRMVNEPTTDQHHGQSELAVLSPPTVITTNPPRLPIVTCNCNTWIGAYAYIAQCTFVQRD
jgi:hypothetical protein